MNDYTLNYLKKWWDNYKKTNEKIISPFNNINNYFENEKKDLLKNVDETIYGGNKDLEEFVFNTISCKINLIKELYDNNDIAFDLEDLTKTVLYNYFEDTLNLSKQTPGISLLDIITKDNYLDDVFNDDTEYDDWDGKLITNGDYPGINITTDVTLMASETHTSPRKGSIKYLVIHYTAGVTSKSGTAVGTAKMFANPKMDPPASADFIVDDDNQVQYNPDPLKLFCWAVGAKKKYPTKGGQYWGKIFNKDCISIEICSSIQNPAFRKIANHEAWYFTDKVLAQALNLTRKLMKQYNIPKSNVIRHYDVTGKLCPGIIGWNEDSGSVDAWNRFYSAI